MNWNSEDKGRLVHSNDALPEDIQDVESPMILVGADIVSLYPNMDISQVSKMIREAIKAAPIKWEGVDLVECARYVALNWDESKCRNSNLKRILPVRRSNNGTRPSIKGKGPMGKIRGDSEQWIFPSVKLEEWEERELIATVIEIAATAMFERHFYTFGGKQFKQSGGGPIGLRGTCAVARLIMQLFDQKWKTVLESWGIATWLISRYMDDVRAMLQAIKRGWRATPNGLMYSIGWEKEDQCKSLTEITSEILRSSLNSIKDFLKFTIETCEDEGFGGWLPTLDTCLRVTPENKIEYKYYEKSTCSERVIQATSAMNINSKMQILSNDMVRRLLNTKEEQEADVLGAITDKYASKLIRSGYSKEQTKRILLNGIKNFEAKRKSRIKKFGSLRSTAARSRLDRRRNKLIGKTSWFKGGKAKNKYKNGKKSNLPGREEVQEDKKEVKSVLFCEFTKDGELASSLRELMKRMEGTLGFGIKVVERTKPKEPIPTQQFMGGNRL